MCRRPGDAPTPSEERAERVRRDPAATASCLALGRPRSIVLEMDVSAPSSARSRARFERLVVQYLDFVVAMLHAKGVRDGDLDDAAQRVFLIALGKLERIEAHAEKAYLHRVAVREASHTRRSYQRRGEVDAEHVDMHSTPSMGPDELVRKKHALLQAAAALEELDADLRSVFVMHELEEMSLPDVSQALGLPLGTVKTRLRRARSLLSDWPVPSRR